MSILWLILACTSPIDDTGNDTVDTSDSAVDTDVPAAPIASPQEATDIDDADDVVHIELTAAPMTHHIGELTIEGYAYNGQTPGPTIRAKVGDRLMVDLQNDLDAVTTIHWHGVSVPYEMDGAVWTLGGVEPGTSFRYEFELTQAGTFWYHPHVDTAHQVDHGLYGVLVVEDPADPIPDSDLVLVFDDWRADDGPAMPVHGRPEGLWTVNGTPEPTLELTGGERVRARLLNVSNHGYLHLTWPDIRRIAGDQGLLPSAQSPDGLIIGPGDRAEVEWLPGEQGFEIQDLPYANAGPAFGDTELRLAVDVISPSTAAVPTEWPFTGEPPPTTAPAPHLTYVFTGQGHDWYINGERFPNITVETLPLNRESVIEIRNLSGSEHPFHIHGMHFEVLSVNGVPQPIHTIEDTWNLAVADRVRVRVNPQFAGFWMTHCHILEHAEEGMMTVIEVPE